MSHYGNSFMGAFDACARIRLDAPSGRGKKCPGGYSIPRNKRCRSLGTPPGGGEVQSKEESAPKKKGKPNMTGAKALMATAGLAAAAPAIAGLTMATLSALKKTEDDPERAREIEEKAKRKAEDIKRRAEKEARAASPPPKGGGESPEARKARKAMEDLEREMREFEEQLNRAAKRMKTNPQPPRDPRLRVAIERAKEFEQQEISVSKEFGLSERPTRSEVKKARKQAAKKYHPDVGGSKDDMARVNSTLDRIEERARKDSLIRRVFYDRYPRWDSRRRCF